MPRATPTKTKSVEKKTNRRIVQAKTSEYLKMMIYGKSSSGKTTLWGSFPGKKLLLLCSSGKGELKSLSSEEIALVDQFQLMEATEDLPIIIDAIKNGGYDWVILDHISEFCFLCMKHILNIDDIPTTLGWGDARIQDYGTMKTQVSKFVSELLEVDCNVIVVGQERVFSSDDDEFDIPDIVNFDATPGVVRALNPMFDYTLQLDKRQATKKVKKTVSGKEITKTVKIAGKMEHFARLVETERYHAKFRKPRGKELPMEMIDPTGQKILDLIKSLY